MKFVFPVYINCVSFLISSFPLRSTSTFTKSPYRVYVFLKTPPSKFDFWWNWLGPTTKKNWFQIQNYSTLLSIRYAQMYVRLTEDCWSLHPSEGMLILDNRDFDIRFIFTLLSARKRIVECWWTVLCWRSKFVFRYPIALNTNQNLKSVACVWNTV